MKTKVRGAILFGVATTAVVFTGVGFAAWLPPVTEQVPPGSNEKSILLAFPANGASLIRESEVTIAADLTGDVSSMQTVEFWDNGVLLGTQAVALPGDAGRFEWIWTPELAGVHVLQARLL